MAKIIAIANQKGGVGKTTTAFNLGAGLSAKGKKILLMDFDPQGNLSSYLGFSFNGETTISDLLLFVIQQGFYQPYIPLDKCTPDEKSRVTAMQDLMKNAIQTNSKEQMDYIPSTIQLFTAEQALCNAICRESILKIILSYLKDSYEYIIIDCPPSLGNLLYNALVASDDVLIPVQAQNFALDGLTQLIGTYQQIKMSLNPNLKLNGFLLTMTNHTNHCKAVAEALKAQFGELVYSAEVSHSVQAADSSARQTSLIASKQKLGKQYMEFVQEFINR